MEGFAVFGIFSLFIALGAFLGNISSTHEITIKDINKGQEICSQHEGLFMIESKRLGETRLHCKDGEKFKLGEK